MRGRFAPSPTGYMHLGNAWTAFLCWLQVRQAGGVLVLRIEDVDEQRSKSYFAAAVLEDLAWLGLAWDEGPDTSGAYGPYIQQERYGKYRVVLDLLRSRGILYPCYCSRARIQSVSAPHAGEHAIYDGHCFGMGTAERLAMTKKPSWRVHVPAQDISFVDGIYGRQRCFLPTACGDFVVRRADGLYAYQLAVAADDGDMAITHVLRGRDLLSSTAQQIWLMQLAGWTAPQYTHVPLLIDSQGRRLSKRQYGISIRQLRSSGLDSQSILSYMAYKGGLVRRAALYTHEELVQQCRLTDIRTDDIVIDDDVESAIHLMRQPL